MSKVRVGVGVLKARRVCVCVYGLGVCLTKWMCVVVGATSAKWNLDDALSDSP